MSTFQGHRVSYPWFIVLTEADKSIDFKLNSGQRTMAEQQALVNRLGVYNSRTNPHGAAIPNPNAPHIKAGHENHAIDVDSWNNGENKLQVWALAHGLDLENNVSTEAWHMDPIHEQQLVDLARKIIAERYITLGSKGLKQLGLKKNLRKLGYLKGFHLGPFGKPAVAALKHFQRDHKLVADGVAGPLTLEAIKAALRRKGKRS
jgi:peptidoglycan hydrolase-like protein with peptidoglycan-binding domain